MNLLKLYLNHDNLFCPVTGHHILSSHHFEPSPATKFVYPLEGDDFEVISDDLKIIEEKVNPEGWEEEADDDDDYPKRLIRFLKAIKDVPNLIVFCITTSGMSCGPTSSTVYVGIDMNYQLR
jgi:hypothetical protein